MSLLVKVQNQPRIVDGKHVAIGEVCRLPDDLATVLCQKGYAVLANGDDHIKDANKRKAKKAAAKDSEKKKRGRPPKDE